MGSCAGSKQSIKQKQPPIPPQSKKQISVTKQESHKFINFEIDQKVKNSPISQEPQPNQNESVKVLEQAVAHRQTRVSVQAPLNKQNKDEANRKQLLKKYDIKVNNNTQRVLSVNSYRYDVLLPHNPQITENVGARTGIN